MKTILVLLTSIISLTIFAEDQCEEVKLEAQNRYEAHLFKLFSERGGRDKEGKIASAEYLAGQFINDISYLYRDFVLELKTDQLELFFSDPWKAFHNEQIIKFFWDKLHAKSRSYLSGASHTIHAYSDNRIRICRSYNTYEEKFNTMYCMTLQLPNFTLPKFESREEAIQEAIYFHNKEDPDREYTQYYNTFYFKAKKEHVIERESRVFCENKVSTISRGAEKKNTTENKSDKKIPRGQKK